MIRRRHSHPRKAVRGGCGPHARGGFTLFEVMLMVVIIGISTGMAMPYFIRSFHGARLRMGTRLVLSCHRQAQNQAILKQQQIALLFDANAGTVETLSMTSTREDPFFSDSMFSSTPRGSVGSGLRLSGSLNKGRSGALVDTSQPDYDVTEENIRKLEDGVFFSRFTGGYHIGGIYYVTYYPNGMCTGYSVTLEDKDGRRSTVEVDAVTGKAKVAT